jgi:arginine utilization protein RocB
MDPLEPARVRELAERLISTPSVSPDPEGERACAAAIQAALPDGLERGEWRLPDGRPVVWAWLRGHAPRGLLLLTHYDTVGVAEFAALADAAGEGVAFRPQALRERLLALDPQSLPEAVQSDLDEERRHPGTWLFGRGALDMKSGIAAGLAALRILAGGSERREGSVLFVACPDEEHQSSGMLHAVTELAAIAERIELVGALNLDYVRKPGGYDGLAGKLLVGCWVLGLPTHVGDPFRGADAAQMAAALVQWLTTSAALTEQGPGTPGVPPVALRLRDLKPRYDAQTALEAELELNLLVCERTVARTMEALRAESLRALEELGSRMARLSGHSAALSAGRGPFQVLTYPELLARAGRVAGEDPLAPLEPGSKPERSAPTLERIRRLAREASLVGPAVVLALLPPYYPRAAPRQGGLADRLRPLLSRRGAALEPFYPFISDACYLSWRDPSADIAPHFPALGREYRPPVERCRALDLEVVTLGPWGRDAHGLFERVHAPYAFGVLPDLLAEAARAALAGAGVEASRRRSQT